MKVFVEYNEPIGPISGFGLGDGTPGGLIIEKRVFLIFFSCGASQAAQGQSNIGVDLKRATARQWLVEDR